jgi:carbamoyl-phosphate synthase large subunit/carbamoyl-phosphate synthase small subunit
MTDATHVNVLEPAFIPAKLVLRDGQSFEGYSFGAPTSVAGEVVFTTGMVGYPESLTDPSFHGQILVLTTPMVGNYGVPPLDRDSYGLTKYFESQDGKIHAAAVIVSEHCFQPEHWQRYQTLDAWLKTQNIPGLMMVDTRSIVLRLREIGTALGKIVVKDADVPFADNNTRNLVSEVSTKTRRSYGHGNIVICCIDMGVKLNTLRCLLRYDITLNVVPHNWDITQEVYDGLFVSNGPGNPQLCAPTIHNVRWALQQDKPVFGICMGNQMLALAAGGTTYKMKYGHRGQNQPCASNEANGKVVITTQNHGFAVDMTSMPPEWEETFTNPNDGSNEGLRHKTKPFFSVQYHPEGRCGPQDTEYLFHDFLKMVEKSKIDEIQKNKPRKVLVLGAGGITIAQAGEFDYSGSQCLKSLREEGIETVLINPNIATVQTDNDSADHVYFVPVTPECVERVIEKERPDGILLGWGGQTALNCGLQLDKLGILKKYNVRVLGTQVSTINVTEDRGLFRDALLQIDEHVAESAAVVTVEEAVVAAKKIGYPVMVRAAFCLGGQGSGIVANEEELIDKCNAAFAIAPQVLIEMSVAGWKEVEYEVVRDIYDNCITVCNMENFDPMGVHTGESMVVAPSQTLTNDEYHMLRTASIRIIRHLGVVGECNIQYGLDPCSHRYVVIEVNPRLSRSSALASKATGYPLAHVAAKLALGKGLSEITNGVTKSTTACFEPSLDYIVMKVPRWDLNKFNMVSNKIGSMMKSVGEVMAIGRTFEEVMQKGLRMVDNSNTGFEIPSHYPDDWDYEEEIRRPTPNRIWAIYRALQRGVSVDTIHDWSKINKFFLTKLETIVKMNVALRMQYGGRLSEVPARVLANLKSHGFSDKQIAKALDCTPDAVRARRLQMNIVPRVKQIDTVAGEFPAAATYLYTSYNAQYDDVKFGEPMYVVLGCGVYRIGNSVEFDYCGVLVARELRRLGHKVIMINYNPETVSTDYDECDRLYFEEVSEESVLDILSKERVAGVVISVGGQIVQNMALRLKDAGLPILGTDPRFIDMAEDRNKFSKMCDDIGISQPEWVSATSLDQVHAFTDRIGFPCLVRPSYVLSGSAMSVINAQEDIDRYLTEASRVSGEHPVVVSKYYSNAIEYDVDVVAHYGKVLCYSISEHVENAGVHSGDATMFLPPQNKDPATMKALYDAVCRIADRLSVCGPMNVQFLRTGDGNLRVIEANVRCSRSVPFVSKTLGISFPAVMVSAFLSKKDSEMVPIKRSKMTHIGCKAAMFSFNRLAGADPILGVEMASTGEVGVFGRDKHEVILKAMLCQNFKYPKRNALISVALESEAAAFVPYVELLSRKLQIYATPIASAALIKAGVKHTPVSMPGDAKEPCAGTMLKNKELDLVIQLRDKSKDFLLRRVTQATAPPSYWVRRLAVDFATPLITEDTIARLFCEAFVKYTPADLEIESFRSYVPKIYRKLENNNCTLLHRHRVGLCVDYDVDGACLALRLKQENLSLTCFHGDLGQKTDPSTLRTWLAQHGIEMRVVDMRDDVATACYDMIMAMAILDNIMWQIGVIGRDVLRRGAISSMSKAKMTVVAQASSRVSREMQFERYAKTIAPELAVYTPWRDQRNVEDFPKLEDKVNFLKEHGLDILGPRLNASNCNLAGLLYKSTDAVENVIQLVQSLDKCPTEPEFVSLTFKEGRCVEINNQEVTPLQAMRILNDLAGRNGIGRSAVTDEEGVVKYCEAPGLALLARGLRFIYDETLDKSSRDIFRTYATHVANQMAQGSFADMSTKSSMVAIKFLAASANGSVALELHKGEVIFLHTTAMKALSLAQQAVGEDDVFTPGDGSFTDFQW